MSFTDAQKSQLAAKLDSAKVKPPAQFGPKGDYLEGWHVIAEANRIFGFDGWSYEVVSADCVSQAPRPIGREKRDGHGVTYTSKVRVTIDNVVREDFGAGHGYDLDLGLAHESAIKEAVTDALKRTLRTFGNPFGLALYDKAKTNVADAADISRASAIESLWQELEAIRTAEGLKSFWMDNANQVKGMDIANRKRFTDKKDAMKASFDKPDDDHFPGDTDITNQAGRALHTMEA